jgi:chromosome partitioning protein
LADIADERSSGGITPHHAPKLSLVTLPPTIGRDADPLKNLTPALTQRPLARAAMDHAGATKSAASAPQPAAPTIAFVTAKGGAGKTTAALLLALGFADQGRRVALIDTDPNGPLLHWAGLPGRPDLISVHAARTIPDLCDAVRAARRQKPDLIIVDTEGSARGAMVFAAVQLDLVVTPLAGSHLDAREAIKSAETSAAFARNGGQGLRHRCLLTRVSAAIQTRGLRAVVEDLKANKVEILPVALVDKEAFRLLFAAGGSLRSLAQDRVWGLQAAQENIRAYAEAMTDLLADRLGDPDIASIRPC